MGKRLNSSHGDRHSSPVPITFKYWFSGKFFSELKNHVLLLKISNESQPEHERGENHGHLGKLQTEPWNTWDSLQVQLEGGHLGLSGPGKVG